MTKAISIPVFERSTLEARRPYRKQFQVLFEKDKITRNTEDGVKASVILISGCQDSQESADGVTNNRFTAKLLQVWDQGRFKGNYRQFRQEIENLLPADQKPNYFVIGWPDAAFEEQTPFII